MVAARLAAVGTAIGTLAGVATVSVGDAASAAAPSRPLYWTATSLRSVPLPVKFVRSPPSLLRECRETAHRVRYAVPCPAVIPHGLQPTSVLGGPCLHYRMQIVGVACSVNGLWRRWVFGSSEVGVGTRSFQHLVISAAPQPTNYAHAVNGPIALQPSDGPRAGGTLVVGGRRMRWLFVDPLHNDGSAFMEHVVLCWTSGGHTYVIGFHAVTSKLTAAAMDYRLALHITLVPPD